MGDWTIRQLKTEVTKFHEIGDREQLATSNLVVCSTRAIQK
jgi:hypothetical protein